jgi:hypothetical protein
MMKTRYLEWIAILALLLIPCQAAMATNLVLNPGFETGDFSNWTQSGNTGYTGIADITTDGPFYVHSGNYGLFGGPIGSLGYISQDIPTVAGDYYDISFWYKSTGYSLNEPNELFVSWGSVTLPVTLFDQVNIPAADWTQYSFNNVSGLAGTTTLTIGLQNDGIWDGLDDISVSPVPEPATLLLLGTGLIMIASRFRKH